MSTSKKDSNTAVKRRRFLIDTHAQGRFLTASLLYLVTFSFIMIVIILFPGWEELSRDGLNAFNKTMDSQMGQFVLDRLVPALFIYLILVGFHNVVMTHRIFGPIYKVEQRLIEATEGNLLDTIHFRKNDFLRGLDISLNRAFSGIVEQLLQIEGELEKLADNIDQLVSGVQSGKIAPQNATVALQAVFRKQEQIIAQLKKLTHKVEDRGLQENEKEIPLDRSLYL